MMKAIEVRNTLFGFLEKTIKAESAKLKVGINVLYHSNVKPDTDFTSPTVYINRQTVIEQQDTLSVDVEDYGKVRYNTVGACVVSFFFPRNLPDGYNTMERLAQGLKNALRKERFDCLWVRNPTATPSNMENNSYRYDVSFSYEFDEIV